MLHLFVGIDCAGKFAALQLIDKADGGQLESFWSNCCIRAYRMHTIRTDNGIQFADQPRNRNAGWSRQMRFAMICETNSIEYRRIKPNHPRTNLQVERMNRTIKEAAVKRFYYESHDQLRTHFADFMAGYSFAAGSRRSIALHPTRTSPKSGRQS